MVDRLARLLLAVIVAVFLIGFALKVLILAVAGMVFGDD